MGCSLQSGPSCNSIAPLAKSDESVLTIKGLLKSGHISTGVVVNTYFSSSKASSCFGPLSHFLSFCSKSFNGQHILENPGINLL